MYAISIDDLRRRHACDLWSRVRALEGHLCRKVSEYEGVPLQVWAAVTPDAEDLIWALRVRPEEGAPIAVEVALRAVERVLPRAGAARPACKDAVAAARGYLKWEVSREALSAAALVVNGFTTDDDNDDNEVAYCAARATFFICRLNAVGADDALYYAAHAAADNPTAERARQRADILELLAAQKV